MNLRDLDARLVPRFALALRQSLDGAAARRAAARSLVRSWWRQLTGPAAPGRRGPLRRLDDRYASSGPLALVRDVPQLGALLVAAVFLAGTTAALALHDGDGESGATDERTVPRTLGPDVGTQVDAYVGASTARLADLSRESPDADHVALVSLERYLTPEQLQTLVGEVEVQRVYLRAPLPDVAAPEVVPVETPPASLLLTVREVYERIAVRRAEDQRELLALARSITPDTSDESEFRAFYEEQAAAAGREAAAYRANCACVMAAVVRAPVRELVELKEMADIRAVQAARTGADLDDLDVRPLLPEVEGEVVETTPQEVPRR